MNCLHSHLVPSPSSYTGSCRPLVLPRSNSLGCWTAMNGKWGISSARCSAKLNPKSPVRGPVPLGVRMPGRGWGAVFTMYFWVQLFRGCIFKIHLSWPHWTPSQVYLINFEIGTWTSMAFSVFCMILRHRQSWKLFFEWMDFWWP